MLMNVSVLNQGTNYFYVQGNYNIAIGQSASNKWVADGQNIGDAVAGETVLIVGRINFGSGVTTYDFWFNPVLGMALGTPTKSTSTATTTSVADIHFRSVANTLTVDEFRMGLAPDDVLPISIAAPTALATSALLGSTFTLSWTASTTTAASYEIYKNGVSIGSSATTSFDVTGLTANTSYQMTVKAKDDVWNYSAASTVLSVTTATTPSAPTITAITPGNGQLSVAFTAGADGGAAISSYKYSIDNGSTFATRQTGTTASPIVINGLTNGTAYNVQIKAINAAGDGMATATTAATPATTPSEPTAIVITPGNGQLSVAFTPGATGGAAISTYYYSINGGLTFAIRQTGTNASPIIITGLTNGTPYNVQIQAVNTMGIGTATATTTATPATTPSVPTGITITPSSGQLSVAFTPGANGGAAISTYKYSIDNGATFATRQTGTTASPIIITGLTNGTPCNVQIKAVNNMGDGTPTATIAATPALPPSAPTSIVITPSSGQLSVAFTAAATGGSAIITYKYSIDNGGTFATRQTGTTASPIVITGLTNGTAYNVQIKAVNAAGDGTPTTTTVASTPTMPSAPTGIIITPSSGQLSVAFTAGADGGSAISNYKYSLDGGANFTACSPVQTSSPVVITGLNNGTLYNLQIKAVSAAGDGTATATTIAAPGALPSVPTAITITPSNGQLSVAFTAGANGGAAISNYKYSIDGGNTFKAFSPVQTTSPIVILGLTNSTAYNVQIKAVNAVGDGTATATTAATPVSKLIVYEPASDAVAGGTNLTTPTYGIGSVAANPWGALNGAVGYPATNSTDGTKISTGLRTLWTSDIAVVKGLTYSNSGGILSTTGNALRQVGANYGPAVYAYQGYTGDPYALYRSSASANMFGYKATAYSLYFSVLLNSNDLTVKKNFQVRSNIDGNDGNNGGILIQQNAIGTNWELFCGSTSKGILGNAVKDKTEFIVGRIDFTAANAATVSVWFNPTLNSTLPAPTQTFTITNPTKTSGTVPVIPNILPLSCRYGAGTLTFDEFRLGVFEKDVMPSSIEVNTPISITSLNTLANSNVTVTASTLTVDAPTTVSNITLAAGSTLITTTSNPLTVGTVTLKADKSTTCNTKLDANIVANSVRLFKTIDDTKWYFMSFPCDVPVAQITKSDGTSMGLLGAGGVWYIKYYDGALRSNFGPSDANWKLFTGPTLFANKGYIFGLKSVGASYDVELSIPLTSTILSTVASNQTIPVLSYSTGTAGGSNLGWNLVGQPFMIKFTGSGANVNYMTFSNGSTYTQYSNFLNTLPIIDPFSAYFVQAGATDVNVTYDFMSSRQLTPSAVTDNTYEVLQLNMSNGTGIDNTTLIMDNAQSADYQIGQDLEKWIGIDSPKPQIYTLLNGINFAFNALPMNSVVNLPVGFYTNAATKITITVTASQAPSLSKLLLKDNLLNTTTDLLVKNYSFDATPGTDNTRFMITAQRIATWNENLETATGEPQITIKNLKLIINDLSVNSTVRVFDALGRLIVNKKTNNSSMEIPIPIRGMYIIHIDSDTKSWTRKIVSRK
jgi:predicted RNA-binding protein with TRAM domain